MVWNVRKTPRHLDGEIAEAHVRDHLMARVRKLLDKWQPILGVKVHEVHVKKMGTYWATMTEGDSRMWVNQQLAKQPPGFLQYVVVHELVHLKTDGHDGKFYALMDQHLPGWRRYHEAKAAPMTQHS